MKRIRSYSFVMAVIAFSALAGAGASVMAAVDPLDGEMMPYSVDSGPTRNPLQVQEVVFEQVINVPLASSLRLHFSDAVLSEGSFVRITAAEDGAVQELGSESITEWNLTTAYFNGETVTLQLVAEPEAVGDQIILDSVEFYHPEGLPCNGDDFGICGDDDRVPSSVEWSGRLMPGGCTASIYSTSSCAVTAAHCTAASLTIYVIQFRVPDSDPDCTLNHPSPADQFPIVRRESPTPVTFQNDWSAMAAGANHLGQRPYERYGDYRPLAESPANPGDFVELWTYGRVNSFPTRNQTQQYSSGSIVYSDTLNYLHNADIIFGSSGGAIIHDGRIIGVQSSADNTSPCENRVARIDIPDFVAARSAICENETSTESKSWGAIKAIHH